MIETVIFVFVGLIAGGFALSRWYAWWPGMSPEDRAYEAWSADCRRRGLTAAEKHDEFEFRMRLAPIRRIASDAVLKSPKDAEAIISKTIGDEMRVSYLVDVDQAKRIEAAIRALPRTDILYPDAEAAHSAYWAAAGSPVQRSAQDRQDFIAALTTLRR